MECPACGKALQVVTVSDVSVDVCRGGCGGIWFDNYELKKFDEPHEAAGQALLDIERNDKTRVDYGKRRDCPKCDGIVMMRHFHSIKRQVEIDECPKCGGIWLDCGELSQIRGLYASEEEREKAVEEYLDDVLNPVLAEVRAHGGPDASSRMMEVFRFLSPGHRYWSRHGW